MNIKNAMNTLGIETLRPFQAKLIDYLLAGNDVCCITPTSSGKSAIYQVFSHTIDSPVIIIEPHQALQLNQVQLLQEKNIKAAYINSLLSEQEQTEILSQMRNGALQLLYLTPEMLQNKRIQKALYASEIGGIMVDEAHCIVKQGPGFREDYLKIGEFIGKLSRRPVVGAFTATATESTLKCIQASLNMDDPRIIRDSISRDNICLKAIEIGDCLGGRKDATLIEKYKREEICRLIDKVYDGRIIIYCNTIKRVEGLYKYLEDEGYSVGLFHGKYEQKKKMLRKFEADKINIMVCTNAFGLGINIPDIRLVIHHSPLIGLDDYTQEVGRAGRDGKRSKAVLLWHTYDFTINSYLIRKNCDCLTGKEFKERQKSLSALRSYAEDTKTCRWHQLRLFFNEEDSKKCKRNCDNCRRKF